MKTSICFLTTTLMLALSAGATAADIERGKSLKQQHCMTCHDDGVYTRPNRRVTTLAGLKNQVRRCELSLGLKWFDEDIDAVTAYLNQSYYKFK